MKLKKIVSLALAGVLAVSMLTACGGNGSSSSSSSSSESTGSATGVSAKVDALLTEKDLIDMTDNSAYAGYLSSVLKKADLDADALLKADTTGQWDSAATNFNTAVVTEMQNQFVYNVNNYAATSHAITNYTKPTTAGDVVYMSVAVFSGELGENVVLKAIADKMNTKLLKDDMPAIIDDSGTLYNATYTGSVSLQKVSDGSASAWFAVVTISVDTAKRA